MKLRFLFLFLLTASTLLAQGVWKQYNGPFAGQISSLASHGDTLFAGSTMTGIFKSNDGGAHWSAAIPEVTYVHGLLVTDTSLLIGSNKLFSYRTSGTNLIQLGQELPGAITWIVDFHDTLFVSTGNGIFRYEPSIDLFIQKNNGIVEHDGALWTYDLVCVDDALFNNVIGLGIYKSDDGGENWNEINVANYPYGFNFLTEFNDTLYCGGKNLYYSPDKGVTWTDIKFNLPTDYLQVKDLLVVKDEIIISTYSIGTYKLTKGENSWIKISDSQLDLLPENDSVFFASNAFGLYKRNIKDAQDEDFNLSNHGINTSRVNGIELFDQKIYSATEMGVHVASVDQDNWSVIPELKDAFAMTIAKKGCNLFVGTSKGLYQTATGSSSWSIQHSSLPIWDIEVFQDKIFIATDEGVYFSGDDGSTWKSLPNSKIPHPQVLYVAANDTMLLAGSNFGLYKILPDSSDWEEVEFFEGDNGVRSLDIIDSCIYVLNVYSQILRSSDQGITWNPLSVPPTARFQMIKRGDNIYANINKSIYSSSNNGLHWEFWSETGTPNIWLTCIVEGENAFYAGTYGKSIWRRPFFSTVAIQSQYYQIGEDVITNVAYNTSLLDFRSNVTLAYGASLMHEPNPLGKASDEGFIRNGDIIKVIAEDGVNLKTWTVTVDDVVTSVQEEKEKRFEVFPVPARDVLFVSNSDEIKTCFISNFYGERVLEPVLQNSQGIEISSLPSGLYFLTVQTSENKRQVLKFIKN